MSRQILAVVVDDHDINTDHGQISVRLHKRRADRTSMPDPHAGARRAAREREPEETVDERFRRWRATDDRTVRNELIEEHRWVAIHCARRFATGASRSTTSSKWPSSAC